MVHPQVADGVDGLQIWKVAVNAFSNQLQMADKVWSFNLGFSRNLITSHCKTPACYEMFHRVGYGLGKMYSMHEGDEKCIHNFGSKA
jgi:hypothetical protein